MQQNKVNNKPSLRFNEYKADWIESKISCLAKLERGRFSPRPRNDPKYYGGDIPFVQTGDVVASRGKLSEFSQTLNDEGLKVSKLFSKGTILITIAANIGHSAILDKDMACPDSLVGIKCNKDIDNQFLNYYIAKKQRHISYLAAMAAQKNVNLPFLNTYKIFKTALEEQKKISSFISNVDILLENLRAQKILLEKYKKSVSQQLFSQLIRFKNNDGKKFPDWKSRKLGQLFTECSDTNGKEILELLSVKLNGGVVPQDESIKRDGSSDDKSKYKIVNVGDIAYNTMRMWQGAFGVSKYKGIVSPAYTVIRLREGNINFYSYLFKQPRTIFNFYRYSQGLTSDTWNLKFRHFSEIEVNIPTDLREQDKIANFLISVDNLISIADLKIINIENWKKGLLQQMFV